MTLDDELSTLGRQLELLLDRHLLVHHGGVFTLKYLEQITAASSADLRADAFMRSRTIGRSEVVEALRLIGPTSKRLLRTTHGRLLTYLRERAIHYSEQRQKALHFLQWWGDSAA